MHDQHHIQLCNGQSIDQTTIVVSCISMISDRIS